MGPVESTEGTLPPLDRLAIRVVHDNDSCDEALRTAWGFAAVVDGPERRILFDTGSDGALLLENMARLHIDPKGIDAVVLSHVHPDHSGGLTGFLKVNPQVDVYLPASFPARGRGVVRGYGATVVEVDGPQEICASVSSTGTLGRFIREQTLVLRTRAGLVVLTGCAHPGIARIVQHVRRLYEGEILLVMGGFHLEWATGRKVRQIIRVFREAGVRFVAPTHCSGEKARGLFDRAYGRSCLRVGVGSTVSLADLV
jgi:7,8-dihydropterin-6-yl-methyl-4-(beta-D-ribofuranosyl)aminobenzene 5'-phosphate synthase